MQAKNCQKTKPWKQTTGPKTAKGKKTSSQNALKSGLHSAEIRKLKTLLRQHAATIKILENSP